jgi:ATP-dependent Lhr-like helicase
MQQTEEKLFRVEKELPFLDPLISEWFNNKYDGLSDPQRKAIPLIHSGKSVLVSSPTGTGKTLSAFLAVLNELFIQSRTGEIKDSVFCLYISPLKALANDIDRNLKEPLREIDELAKSRGNDFPKIRVGVRSGDTSQSERQKMLRKPPHILITTPESFTLSLTAPKFREHLKGIKYVIIDEIHEISANKRGTLLSANLERLEAITGNVVRIGLSATQAPLELIANYLCGYEDDKPREVSIIEADTKKSLDLKVLTPVDDLTKVSYEVANERMYSILVDLIKQHRTTLIFTNTRSGTEHVAMRLKARGIESIEAHHSSLGKDTRIDVESRLKSGELQCVITSTSLELGIDIGFIDLVIQIGSPKSVSKGLQRIGRSGHGLDVLSKGRFVVFELDDLVECAVLTKAAYDKEIDRVTIPTNSLDVLSQVIVGMSLEKAWDIEEAFQVLRRSFSYHTLDHDDYVNTLKYLGGQVEDQTIYSKIWFDEQDGKFGKKRSSRMIFFMNVGTIPEEADYQVINEAGKHLGQLSDKFVERLKPGDVFVLGAKIHMYLSTRRNRVIVKDASGMRPTVPSWTGEMLPRSYDLGVLVGKFREEVSRRIAKKEDVESWLMEDYRLDSQGARSIISYIRSQGAFGIPTNDWLLVEGYIDNAKLHNTIYHVPLGRRVNDALSRGIAQAISNNYSVNTRITVTDDGFMLTTNQKIPIAEQIKLIKKSDFNDLVRRSIINTEVFKQRFRHCATRSLMVLRKYKGFDISVVRQQLRSDKVLRTLGSMESFPVIKETFHEIMNDMMDVPRALKYVDEVIKKDRFDVLNYSSESSPFSYGLILAGISDIVLMEDRSKLLKELQGKILDKIYTGGEISFMFRDTHTVENYFLNKIPKINSPLDLIAFYNHFLTVDPMRNRFNSPFPYTNLDIIKPIEESIENDSIVSVYMRGTQWTSMQYYSMIRTIFEANVTIDENDKMILDGCSLKTLREIRSATKLEEAEVRASLTKLESAYLIRRKIRDSQVYFIKNQIVKVPEDREKSIMHAIELLLGSIGPLTFDEIMLRFPVSQEILQTSLDTLVKKDVLKLDFITPVFSKQYIMQSDLQSLLSGVEIDAHSSRLLWFEGTVQNLEEYFEKYGFALDTWSMNSRIGSFSSDRLKEMIAQKLVFSARFIRHKKTYAASWLVEALHALRYEEPDNSMRELLAVIRNGANSEDLIHESLGMDRSLVMQMLKNAEFFCLVGRDSEGRIVEIMGDREPISKNAALEMLIEKYGPVSLAELSYAFWFYTTGLEAEIAAERSYRNSEVLYGKTKNQELLGQGIIISSNDPISLYIRNDLKNSEYDYHFVFKGKLGASFNLEIKEDSLIISEGNVQDESFATSLVSYLSNLSKKQKFSTVIYEGAPDLVVSAAKSEHIRVTGASFSIGEIAVVDLPLNKLVQFAAHREYKNRGETDSIYDSMKNTIFGFSNDLEAFYSGISPIQLNSYIRSRVLYTFKGPFSLNVSGTLESASLFRTLREKKLTEADQRILRLIMETNGISEKDIILNLRTNIFGIGTTLKSLYSRSVIAKDSSRRFVFVPEKFKKREATILAIRGILEKFGFVDWERYNRLTLSDDQETFDSIIRDMVKAGKVVKTAMNGGSRIMYATNDLMDFNRNITFIRVFSPREVLSVYLQDFIKAAFGAGQIYIVAAKSGVHAFKSKAASSGSKKLEPISDDNIPNDVRRELLKLGFSLGQL